MTVYKLVQCVDGLMIVSELNEDNVIPAMEARGYSFNGVNANPKQRAELQGHPKFKGVSGPMWDGGPIRYECPEANERLST